YDLTQKKLMRLPQENYKKLNLDNRRHAIFKDNVGKLWIGNTFGLRCYDAKTGNSISIPDGVSGLGKVYVRVIKQDFSGQIWFGTEYNGIFIYNPDNESCTD